MKNLSFPVLITALSVSFPAFVHAQGGVNGSIMGSVYDQTGQPIKGVKVAARSDTQIGGSKVVYTNDEGNFRIVGLQPGAFDISATAPKLKTVLQKDIRVGLSAPAEVDLVMEVETQVEEVRVIEKAPIISTTTANVKEVYDEDFVDMIPQDSRTAVESFVGTNSPGAVNTGERSVRIRGGGNNQSQMNVEGFLMNGQKITHKALAAFEVQTAGYGTDGATAGGGMVNMVTKSGSNKFEFDFNTHAEDSAFKFFKDNLDTNDHSFKYMVNPGFSGPIIKDRLWYYANLESRVERGGRDKDPAGFFPQREPYRYENFRGSIKLTWQVTPRNKLQSFSQFNMDKRFNELGGVNIDQDAQQTQNHQDMFTGLIWETLLADNVFLRSQVGYSKFWQYVRPQTCNSIPTDCLHIIPIVQTYPQTIELNNFSHTIEQRIQNRWQVVNQIEWFANSKRFGEHSVKLKDDFYTEFWDIAQTHAGDQVQTYNGLRPSSAVDYFANDPRVDPARYGWFIRGSTGTRNTVSLNDSMRFTRYLTLNPGVSFVTARGTTSTNDDAVNQVAWVPAISAAWDATHDGRTVIRGSFNAYVDVDVATLSRHKQGGPVTQKCSWSETSQKFDSGCVYSGGVAGQTIGLPCGPSGVDVYGNSCLQNLRIPRTWEYTFGAEREIVQGVGLGGDIVYRQFTHPYETVETNRIWNQVGTALEPTGGYRNGRNQTISDMETPDGAKRRYTGFTLSLKKREGAFKLTTSYTLTFLKGNVLDGTGNEYGDVAPRDVFLYGYLSDDSRHQLRATGTYQFNSWLSAGMNYRYSSGRPYSRKYYNSVLSGYTDYRARTGYDAGGNINDPMDDRAKRLPDVQSINFQVRLNLKPLIGHRVELAADILNILALRTTTSVTTDDGKNFDAPTGRMSATSVRLIGRYKY